MLPGSPAEFAEAVLAEATPSRAADPTTTQLLAAKRRSLTADASRPLEAYRVQELAEMSRDIFDDRHGFAAARRAFVTKQRPQARPVMAAR